MRRLLLAFRCFFAVLLGKSLPSEVAAERDPRQTPSPASPPAPPVPAAAALPPPPEGAVRLLSLLQREGRLLDFLQEEIDGYGDAQIGAAVRDIHRGCRRALVEHLGIEPIMSGPENGPVRVDDGFDATAIRLVGNVAGRPPYSGVLRHHGWRATRVELPQLGTLAQPAIIAPAEVELS